jgi:ACS family tartrate transporter-like MFS transporter
VQINEQQIFAKCAWRLVPFMALLYLVNFIDRVNVGFAALTMNADLGFSYRVFGFGAGIFFVSYVLFGVPANWVLLRLGARRWVFLILAIWGVVSTSHAFIQGTTSFYALRFLLGAAEAGFWPAIIIYLTQWFPQAYLARQIAAFQLAIPFSYVVGGSLAGVILGMDGVLNLRGWQWLFLLEGFPPIVLAFAVLKFLPDSPADARWLDAEEKQAIAARFAAERTVEQRPFWSTLVDLRLYALGLAFGGNLIASYGIGLWLPQIVQAMGYGNTATGFIVALPYLAGMAAMILWARSSDMTGERIRHIVLPWLFCALGLAAAAFAKADLLVLLALGLATIAMNAASPSLNSLVKSMLSGPAAASGMPLYNAIGSLGGFVGPYLIGALKQASGSYSSSMVVLSFFLVLSAAIVIGLGRVVAAQATTLKVGA